MPLIASRLRLRRQTKTMTVKAKSLTGGQHSETNFATGLTMTHDPTGGEEIPNSDGEFVVSTDIFWYEGELAILASHVLEDESNGTRYNVVATPVDQAGGGNRLKIMTRRVS